MGYQIPACKLNGKNLVHFGAWKERIGFYATPSGNVESFRSTRWRRADQIQFAGQQKSLREGRLFRQSGALGSKGNYCPFRTD
jgi:hypothetical protein